VGKYWKERAGLLAAVLGGDSEKVRLMLAENPELRAFLEGRGIHLIHTAAHRGDAGVVRVLAEAGFDVTAEDANGWTPLRHAVEADKVDCVFPLVEFGADVNAAVDDGWAPLHIAVRNGNPMMVAALCGLKADPNVSHTVMRATPLHIACYLDRDLLIAPLLYSGADPTREDINGMTPVAIAVHEGNSDARRAVHKWLREHGDDGPEPSDLAGDDGPGEDEEAEPDEVEESDDSVFTTCDWCGRSILLGNACVSVTRSIEQVEWNDELETEEMEVIESESLLELCAACGNRLDTAKLRRRLLKRGGPKGLDRVR
jgi:hypothetical protein